MGGGKTEKRLAELGVKRRLCTFCGKDASERRLGKYLYGWLQRPVYGTPQKGLVGFPPVQNWLQPEAKSRC